MTRSVAGHVVTAWALACLAAPARGDLTSQFISAGTDIATRLVTDPGNFLFDIHLNAEDQSPLPIGKVFSFSTNIFPTLIPFTQLGIEIKGQAHREHGSWPQIDYFYGTWNSLAVTIGNKLSGSTEFSGSLNGYHAGIVVAESLSPRLRVFGGYEFTQMRADVSFARAAAPTPGGTGTFSALDTLSSISVGVTEHFVFAGAEVYRTPVKRFNAEVGYGLVGKRIMLRVIWASPHFDTGLNFYPEGAWTLWPFMNFQWRY